jgi:hypothetical protein
MDRLIDRQLVTMKLRRVRAASRQLARSRKTLPFARGAVFTASSCQKHMRLRTRARMLQWIFLLAPLCGCDDVGVGQPSESTAPPQLLRVTVQDVRGLAGNASPAVGFVQRNSVVDLLDTGAGTSCSDINPCVGQYTIDYVTPSFACMNNTCTDPLRVPTTGVPLSIPLGVGGDAGSGMQLRLVFSKVLDAGIESIAADPTKPPGKTLSYTLQSGIIELDDDTGMEVPCVKVDDNSGVSTFPSDVMIAPFGPALILKPKAPLSPSTKYTVKLNPAKITDRAGRAAIGPDGKPFAGGFSVDFTTEPLTANPGGSFPNFSKAATITPIQTLQLAYWEPIDETTAQLTVNGPAGVSAIAYADRGSDPKMCSANPWILDVVNAPGGTPADWPVGDYTLTLTVKDASGKSSLATGTLKFSVAGSGAAKDPQDWRTHVAPSQCSSSTP